MLTFKNGQFGIASEYDQTVEPIINAIENVDACQNVNVFNENDITSAEFRRMNENQKILEQKRQAQKTRFAKEAYIASYNDLFRKKVEKMNRQPISNDDSLLSEAVRSGKHTEIWTGQLGPSRDYPKIINSKIWGGEMSGHPGQMGFDLGNWWDTFSESVEEQAEAEIEKAGQQLVTTVVSQVTGQQPSSGTVVAAQPVITSPIAAAQRSYASLSPQIQQYIKWGAIGLGSLIALMLILKIVKK